ncbi:hypothetical protein ACFL6I_04160, partial [candidate division KSB1 bacterium]
DLDTGNLPNPLGVRVDLWGLQWDDFINQDFIIFRMKVTNDRADQAPIEDFFIGMHDDPDTPEQGSQEWTDDFAKFIPVGADQVEGYTAEETEMLANFAYLWDGDDRVEGFMASNVPWVGLKVLETPEDPANPGEELGLTTLDVFEYSQAPQTESGEYDQIAGDFHVASPDDPKGVMDPINPTPHEEDWTQTPNTYGPDITYVFASGPFQLNYGESLTFALASVHATSKTSLFLNALRCQSLWNASLLASESPPQPIVRAVPGDKKVSLYWGNESELGVYEDGHVNDKQTGNNLFQGYKVYRSSDQGISWGTPITDINGGLQGYIPLAHFDLADGINGESATRRFFHLGNDTGLKHYYLDQNVSNGFEYWYAVNAYDSDDGAVPPLENSIKTDPDRTIYDNTVSAVPQAPPTGAVMAEVTDAAHIAGDAGVESFETMIVDENEVTGHTYRILFDEGAGGTTFSVVDQDDGMIPLLAKGDATASLGDPAEGLDFFDAEFDNAPIFDGVRIEVLEVEPGPEDEGGIVGTNPLYDTDDGYYLRFEGHYLGVFTAHEYEIEFTTETYDCISLWGVYGFGEPDVQVPFKITDLATAEQVTPIFQDGYWSGEYNLAYDHDEDAIIIRENLPYGSTQADAIAQEEEYGGEIFIVRIDGSEPVAGDKITITNRNFHDSEDIYEFSSGAHTEAEITTAGLTDIQAVPNPFIVSSRFETGAYGFQKELQFHQLPNTAKIRIYNIAGDFIREINHSGGSVATWDLQSFNGQEVAFGVYIFHVNVPGVGEHIGKFAIIK